MENIRRYRAASVLAKQMIKKMMPPPSKNAWRVDNSGIIKAKAAAIISRIINGRRS